MAATILIAEVDTDPRTAFSLLFQRAGYDVLTAPDGGVALDTATRLSPDLVIVNLVGENGPDMCRALHADVRTAGTPVILMTAALYPDAAAAAHAGAEGFMTKPLDNSDLLHHVQGLLSGTAHPLDTSPTPAGSSDHLAERFAEFLPPQRSRADERQRRFAHPTPGPQSAGSPQGGRASDS